MKNSITMTNGPLLKNMILFSIPLMLSNVLQVLFNMSDIAVVGRFSGATALGSIGSCSILAFLFTSLMLGMGSGINAVTANFIGAGRKDSLRRAVFSSFIVSIAYGIIIMIIGLLSIKSILVILHTKPDLLGGAIEYMTIVLLGTPALALYNCGNGILSAAGDSKRPLIYLSIAGVTNVLLNLFFVICFGLGVRGVAIATVIAQYLSAIMIIIRLVICKENYAFKFDFSLMDTSSTKKVLILGISAGIQAAIFAIANLYIQSAVNSFDTVMVEGNSAAANADGFIYDMMAALYAASASFIAQNYGAGNKKRILHSYFIGVASSFLLAAIAGIILFVFGEEFLTIFTKDEAVIAAGMKRIGIMAWSYCVSAFMDCTISASRGLGKTVVPTIFVILGSCVFRIVWIYTIFAQYRTIPSLYLLYVFSWSITAVFEIAYFLYVYRTEILALKKVE